MTSINPDLVESVFVDCLFKKDEDQSGHVKAEGITMSVGFHPGRLEGNRAKIKEWLSSLPDEFKTSKGGGWSFLNACNDKDGNQWTGLHQRMEQLFLLGIGIGKVKCLMSREMWAVLPGGMPYYSVAC